MVDDNLEEGIQQQDTFRLNRGGVQRDKMGWTDVGVTFEGRENHEHSLSTVFAIEHVPTNQHK